jgi:hypothetical protein
MRQLGRTESRRNSDIGCVTAPGNDDAADAGMVMPRIEGEPTTVKEHFVPRTKIHGSRVTWNTDVTEISRAVARRDVHASGKRNCEMSEVPTNTASFLVPLGGGAVTSCMMVTEFNAVVGVIANSLRSLPSHLDTSKERPRKIQELFSVAVATGQQEVQRLRGQRTYVPLARCRAHLIRQPPYPEQ